MDDPRAWDDLLDRLEQDLDSVEGMLAGEVQAPLDPWDPPRAPAPMSSGHVERTRELVIRQQAALERLEAARTTVRRHLQLVDADAAKGLASGPHFFDERT